MYEIKENVVNNIVINKSTFITHLIKIRNEKEVKSILENLKKEYKDATHYCYAYITHDSRKSFDDGEPGGTAGIPILEILIKNNITNILCVVIRYFGGIKLGTGGLARAYSKSAKEAINKTACLELIKSFEIELTFNYDKIKIIDNILKDMVILNKEFGEIIKYVINIDCKNEEIISKLKNICLSCKITKDSFILKEPAN